MQSGVFTMLFTDLVGSTELTAKVGDDAADEIRRSHFAALREAIGLHAGEEVKSVGDGLMAVFSSPSDALGCAVAMQQAAELQNRKVDQQLGLRVGLHVGEVSVEEDDYYGTTVVIAERLCKCADGGQILASDIVRVLAGSRGGHSYADVGSFELKGISEPVAALEVRWEPLRASVPLPHPLVPENVSPFVGRDAELQELRTAYKRLGAGERKLVFLVGEPGIGKSRLCAQLAREAFDDGATVLYGRCDEEALAPYQPFVEALRHYAGVLTTERLRAITDYRAADLAPLVPDLVRRLPDVQPPPASADPEADRLRLFDAAVAVLTEASHDAPLVLVLDDLHWADRPTLQLFRHLLRAEAFPILIVATYRETDLDRAHPLSATLGDLRREHPFDRIHLRGLGGEDVVLALERMSGHDVGRRGRTLAEALVRATDGNPFFIEQILGHLVETGRLYQRDGQWTFDVRVEDLGIPEGVKEVIGRRLSRLSEETNRALAVAAVVGRDFSLEVVERVSDLSEDQLVNALDEAVAVQIVAESGGPGRFTFSHALVRETLYEELSATRRVLLHRRTAAVLQELASGDEDQYVAELAHHLLEAAQVAEVDAAIAWARRAAGRAMSLVAYEDAARFYERALAAMELGELDDPELRCDLLLGLGETQWKSGDLDRAHEALLETVALARELGDAARLGQAALLLAGPPENPMLGRAGDAVGLLDEALAGLGPEPEPGLRERMMARLAAALLLSQPDTAERRVALAREALESARRLGRPDVLAYVLRASMIATFEQGNLAEDLATAEEILELATQSADRELELYARGHLMVLGWYRGDADAAREGIAMVEQAQEEVKQAFFDWGVRCWRAAWETFSGRFETAERAAFEAFEIASAGWPELARNLLGAQLFMLRWHQGRLAELEAPIRAIVEQFPEFPTWRYSLCFLLAETDQLEEARQIFNGLADGGFAHPDDATWFMGMCRGALACAALGDDAAAETLYERLIPHRSVNVLLGPGWSSAGSMERYLGLLAGTMQRWDDAEGHFVAALRSNERMGSRPFVAWTQYDYASMLLRRDGEQDGGRARELLNVALADARELGMVKLVERCEAALETHSLR